MTPRATSNGRFLDQKSFVEHLEFLPTPDDIVQALQENAAAVATPATHPAPTATPATGAAPTATTTTVTTTMAGTHGGQNRLSLPSMFQLVVQPTTNPTQQVQGPNLNQSEAEEVMDHETFMQTCKDFELMAVAIERLFESTKDDLTNTLNDYERHSDDRLTILEMQDALNDFTDFHWEVLVIAIDMALSGAILSLMTTVDNERKRSMLDFLSRRKGELSRIVQRLDSHEVKTGVFAEEVGSLLTSVFEKLENTTIDWLQEGNEAEQPAVASV